MATTTLTLNNIIASNNAIIFDTSDGLLIGDNEPTSVMDPTAVAFPQYNKWNFNDLTINSMCSNIYPLSSFMIQSYQYKIPPAHRQNNETDFIDLYAPDVMPIKSCQHFDYGYFLTDLTNKSITSDELIFNTDINATSYLANTNVPINTYVYPSSAIIMNPADPNNVATSGESTFIPLYNLTDILFNFFEEIPLDFNYYNFEPLTTSGYYYINGDCTNTKNQYNYDYNMVSRVTSTTSVTSVSAVLDQTRKYSNIGVAGDLLYMVYRTNQYYSSGTVSLSSNTTGVTFGMVPTSSFANSGSIVPIPMTGPYTKNYGIAEQFDAVEVIDSLDRLKNTNGHKTNLFSINIKNANINTAPLSATDIANIKNSLTNIIENVISNVIPANTQLFKIYWNGQ